MKKKITVRTNDQKNPKPLLTIQGPVNKFVTISPRRVTLHGHIGNRISKSVTIRKEAEYPFKIIEARAQKGKDIKFTWKEYQDIKGVGYRLFIENLRKKKGQYYDSIILKTDSEIQPEIKISIYGNILDDQQKTGAQPS